ncbi:MAG: hypothetical protein PHH85_01895 [Candidatus Methanoperedens sp.]|nr:hypothetical protein [Candidatus Methanoperedens sp.]
MSNTSTISVAAAPAAESSIEQQEILNLTLAEELAHSETQLRELAWISDLEPTCQDCIQGSLQICGEHCTVVVK